MAELEGKPSYRDRGFKGTVEEREHQLKTSTTLYVGHLSFYTTEGEIWELFSRCGDLKRIKMGIDRYKMTPCGFCFVEFEDREDAETCMRYVNGTRLDDMIVRTDWDAGFVEGRQYGRGMVGGQLRDETTWNPKLAIEAKRRELTKQQQQQHQQQQQQR